MKDLIDKAAKRLQQQKHVDAKDLGLNTLFPIMRAMWAHFEQMSENVDANFADVYGVLNLAGDGSLIEQIQEFIVMQGSMVDDLMLLGGQLENKENQEGYTFAEGASEELKNRYLQLQNKVVEVMSHLNDIREAVESEVDEDDEDEDDLDEDQGEVEILEEENKEAPQEAANA
jgi:hypothetical protein